LKDYYRPLLAESCQDCQVRFYKNPLRMLDCKEPQDQPKIAAAPKISDYLCEPCREHFDAVQRFLRVYDVPFELDPLIVRGLDYYTRTVFEFTSDIDKLALVGGGRYDGLAEILGGAHTPGIGFGAGIERAIQVMKMQKITPPADEHPLAFVVYFGKLPEYKVAAVRTVATLRRNSIKTEMAYGERSAKSQMKQANNSGACYAVLIGEQELEGGFVTVKDLQAEGLGTESNQVAVKEEELTEYLQKA
jgi:histidyl-tRNA synthetase